MRRIGSLVPYLKKGRSQDAFLFSSVASDQTVSVKLGEYLGHSDSSSFSREPTEGCFASRLWIGGEALALCQTSKVSRASVRGWFIKPFIQSRCWFDLCYRLGGQVTSVRRNPSLTNWQRRHVPLTGYTWRRSTLTYRTTTSRVCLRPLDGSSLVC